jgi:hypothetical protein
MNYIQKLFQLLSSQSRDNSGENISIQKTKEFLNGQMVERWYKDGLLHREDGPAYLSDDGTKKWYVHGKLHRTNGPSIISVENDHLMQQIFITEEYYLDGERHNENGPALIRVFNNVGKYEEWWFKGRQITKEQFDNFCLYKTLDNDLPIQNNLPTKQTSRKIKI